jgi:DNA-binding FadR family transcriptional regulator
MPIDDKLELRTLTEAEIAKYLAGPRKVEDVRRLCQRVALAAAKQAYPIGFAEGVIFVRSGCR